MRDSVSMALRRRFYVSVPVRILDGILEIFVCELFLAQMHTRRWLTRTFCVLDLFVCFFPGSLLF